MSKKYYQIWGTTDIPEQYKVCMDRVKSFIGSYNYELVTVQESDPVQARIKSDFMRIEICANDDNAVVLDCDMVLNKEPICIGDKPHTDYVAGLPHGALIVCNGNKTLFRNAIDAADKAGIPRHQLWYFRKAMRNFRDVFYKIEDDCFEHKFFTSNKVLI